MKQFIYILFFVFAACNKLQVQNKVSNNDFMKKLICIFDNGVPFFDDLKEAAQLIRAKQYMELFKVASKMVTHGKEIYDKCFKSNLDDVLDLKCLQQCCTEKKLMDNEHVKKMFKAFEDHDPATAMIEAFTMIEENEDFRNCWLNCYKPEFIP